MTEPAAPVTETVASVVPEVIPAVVTTAKLSPEELQKRNEELERHAKNKEEEAARVQKKLAAFEKAEEDRKQAAMTEAEKAAAKLKELEEKNKALERDLLIRKVAAEAELPAALAERLQGSTEEELKADAAKLKELIPVKPTAPNLNPTNPDSTNTKTVTDEQRRDFMFKNGTLPT